MGTLTPEEARKAAQEALARARLGSDPARESQHLTFSDGIGRYTVLFSESFQPDKLFAVIGVLTLMAILINEVIRTFERWMSRWRGHQQVELSSELPELRIEVVAQPVPQKVKCKHDGGDRQPGK